MRGRSHGTIEIICGNMGAGKSAELIRRLKRAQIGGLPVLAMSYANDNRYLSAATEEEGRHHLIVSHDQLSMAAEPVSTLEQREIPPSGTVIGIDEAQFVKGVVEFCQDAAAAGCRVIVAFLATDFRNKPWPVADLLPLAEEVTKLCAVCHYCKSDKAAFTKRIGDCKDRELIGGLDVYRPACRDCYGDASCVE
jgi:thymidine kinase